MSVREPARAERLLLVLARDGGTCVWCGRGFDRYVRPTTEHVVPKVKGGPSWLENEVAAATAHPSSGWRSAGAGAGSRTRAA